MGEIMDKIKVNKLLNYAAGDDEHRDLYVTVELTDDLYLKDEEKIIDGLMEKFYKVYDWEMQKLREDCHGKNKTQETKM